MSLPVAAEPAVVLAAVRTDTGLHIDFDVPFELSSAVEGALLKGIALNFVADVEVFRKRWYWRDLPVAKTQLKWRLYYQPLTRQYRVLKDMQTRNFDALPEALVWLQRASQWWVADAAALDPPGQYWLQFIYQLDTTQLPRPVQVGVGGQPDWALMIQKKMSVPPLSVLEKPLESVSAPSE